jgi:hypothetical protein
MQEDPSVLKVEAAFSRTAAAKRLRRKIIALQRRLRRRLDRSDWAIYLALDECVNERQARFLSYLYRQCDCDRARGRRRTSGSAKR